MGAVPIIQLPLDLTGSAATNLVQGELHDLSGLAAKAFVPNYGPFYVNGLVVRNHATGQPLTLKTPQNPNGQYIYTQLFIDLTFRTGLEVCSIIVIEDPTLPADLQVDIDYQAVGGEYSASVDAIQQLIDALDLGNQPVNWLDIVGKPILFPPAPHLHDLGDIYGFEYIVAGLERIQRAILTGDQAQFNAVYQYIDHQIALVTSEVSDVSNALTAHLADFGNPHRTTKTQIGLPLVDNFATATTADGEAGTASNLFMTPAATSAAITTLALGPLNAHIADKNNPHATTKAQVGLGLVDNFATSTNAAAQQGTATNLFMTPATTSAAITTLALGPLNNHLNDFGNPHRTTAAQVNLGNVPNFPLADVTSAQNGTSNAMFMSPSLTAAAINAQALVPLNNHLGNFGNPHRVTAAQTGTYSQAQIDASNNNLQTQINGRPSTATVQSMINAEIAAVLSIASGSAQEGGFYRVGSLLFQTGVSTGPAADSYRTITFGTPFPNTCVFFSPTVIDSQGQRSQDNLIVQNVGDRRSQIRVHNSPIENVYMWLAMGY